MKDEYGRLCPTAFGKELLETDLVLDHHLHLLCMYQVEHFRHKLRMKTSTAEFPIAAAPVQMEECISMHAQEIQLNHPRDAVNS